MKDPFKFPCLLKLFLVAFPFMGIGCKKDPMPMKHVVYEFADTGASAQYEYEANGRIKHIVTSNGTDISYRYVTGLISPFAFNGYVDGIAGYDKDGYIFEIYEYFSSSDNLYPHYVSEPDIQVNGYKSISVSRTYEYNSNGNLKRMQETNPVGSNTEIYNWQDGNLLTWSSTVFGSNSYEYYTNKVNTLGNAYFGRSFLGVSSKNPVKRVISYSSAGNTTTDYDYEFDDDGYITKATLTITDPSGNVSTSWRQFTYE